MYDVYQHEDYRSAIRAWMAVRPEVRTQRWLARALGASPAKVNMVLSGQRNVTIAESAAWTRAMRLAQEPASYFEALVRAAHAPTPAMQAAAESLAASMREWQAIERESRVTRLYAAWHYAAVLELARCEGFVSDPRWIAEHLWPPIDVSEAAEALDDLVALGLLKVDADGAIAVDSGPRATVEAITDAELSEALRSLHRDHLAHGAEALDTFDQSERFFGSMTVALPADRLDEVVTAVTQLQLEAVEQVRQGRPDRVFQLSIALFPRSDRVG